MNRLGLLLTPALAIVAACSTRTGIEPQSTIDASRQLLLVIVPDWTSTLGTMTRWKRSEPRGAWEKVGDGIPVVVGRTGLAWGVGFDQGSAAEPRKREGDGKAPAGIFPLDTVFGFAPRDSLPPLRLPYVQLRSMTECVDDVNSLHYNTVVDKDRVTAVDWQSAEHMREVSQYKIGVIVGYNKPPARSRGSCIFLHIWNGPTSHTAGCTAFDEEKLREVIFWLDSTEQPLLVQLPEPVYARMRSKWQLPQA